MVQVLRVDEEERDEEFDVETWLKELRRILEEGLEA